MAATSSIPQISNAQSTTPALLNGEFSISRCSVLHHSTSQSTFPSPPLPLSDPFSHISSPTVVSACSPSTPITQSAASPTVLPHPPLSMAENSTVHFPSLLSSTPPQSTSNSAPNIPQSQRPLPRTITSRLSNRNTLDVPRVASRLSKEIPAPDDSHASGRFTPNPTPRKRQPTVTISQSPAPRSTPQTDGQTDDFTIEDNAKWAENNRQKKVNKRRREDDDELIMIGTKVDHNHVNWVTAYDMLTGIRFTVSRTNAKLDRDLTDADFVVRHKFSFDIIGNELTPSAKYDFKFKDYAPWVFRHLRSIFRLDPADYLMSLTSKYILSELGSPGKSGSFFYFSRDYKYIIKTIHHSEHKFLRRSLREYHAHVIQNPNTLLSQFYGLHRVKIPYGRKIHFVVMNNLFPPHRDIHQTYDLKGSIIGRESKEDENNSNPRETLKDLNWIRRNRQLQFGPTKKQVFLDQVYRDVALLQRLHIMDYSLLVGIHDLSRGNDEQLRDKTLKVFHPGAGNGDDSATNMILTRSASTVESQRKAQEFRQMIKTQKPTPMGQSIRMPDEIESDEKKDRYFYKDDGGIRASLCDDQPGDEIYYIGIIDCLTHYGILKRFEHFFKGLAISDNEISAIPPDQYGERFIQFISGIIPPTSGRLCPKGDELLADGKVSGEADDHAKISRVGEEQTQQTPVG